MITEFSLAGRTALVTGAGRGIGTGIAEVLAEAGADVAVNALTGKYLDPFVKDLAQRSGRKIVGIAGDCTTPAGAAKLLEQAAAELGPDRHPRQQSRRRHPQAVQGYDRRGDRQGDGPQHHVGGLLQPRRGGVDDCAQARQDHQHLVVQRNQRLGQSDDLCRRQVRYGRSDALARAGVGRARHQRELHRAGALSGSRDDRAGALRAGRRTRKDRRCRCSASASSAKSDCWHSTLPRPRPTT